MAKRTKHLTSQGEESDEVRINKFLSEAGVCSRREADRFIQEGKIQIDGVTAVMGSKVGKDSLVTFEGKPIKKEEKLVLIAFNKPEGIVCTTDPDEPDNIVDYIQYGMRIYPIGRLDKDSEGLILLTNDGNIVNRILRAENHHEKEYIVSVNNEVTQEFIHKMSQGVPILGKITNPCEVTPVDRFTFRIILTQGMNRQIRRMCEYFGYRVIKLTRIRIMNIQLGRLKTGMWRNVTEKEIAEMNQLLQSGKQGQKHQVTAAKLPSSDTGRLRRQLPAKDRKPRKTGGAGKQLPGKLSDTGSKVQSQSFNREDKFHKPATDSDKRSQGNTKYNDTKPVRPVGDAGRRPERKVYGTDTRLSGQTEGKVRRPKMQAPVRGIEEKRSSADGSKRYQGQPARRGRRPQR